MARFLQQMVGRWGAWVIAGVTLVVGTAVATGLMFAVNATPLLHPQTSPSLSPSAIATPSESPSPQVSPSPSASPSPAVSPSPLPSPSPSPIASPSPVPSPVPSPNPSPAPSPNPSPGASPTPSPTLAGEVCGVPTSIDGQSPPLVADIDALRTGVHTGYDRFTIQFNNGQPTKVEVSTQSGTIFTASPSGQSVTLLGQNGILLTLRGADAHSDYSGTRDIKTGDHGLIEVRQVQDFEGVVQFALGVNGYPCYRVFILSNPTKVVIDVPNVV